MSPRCRIPAVMRAGLGKRTVAAGNILAVEGDAARFGVDSHIGDFQRRASAELGRGGFERVDLDRKMIGVAGFKTVAAVEIGGGDSAAIGGDTGFEIGVAVRDVRGETGAGFGADIEDA